VLRGTEIMIGLYSSFFGSLRLKGFVLCYVSEFELFTLNQAFESKFV